MKKILLPFDGTNFSQGALEFTARMNEMQPVLAVGVFAPQTNLSNLWSYASAPAGVMFIPLVEEEELTLIQNNIRKFKSFCKKNGIEHRVHKAFDDFALPELAKESRFADLLILGSESFYKDLGADEPNDYLRETVKNSECPVLLVPEHFQFPENIILAFDGSESSVYAIKLFTYLFPELCKNETMLVYAGDNDGIPDEEYIEELAGRHFANLTLARLQWNPKSYFSTWVSSKKSPILISGSFGRSIFAQAFKKSFVTEVVRDHKLPVFVAHK
jgi:hypothetical protein